ncbi:MAG: MFS transporter [Roseiflexaceae bacterium]
MRKTLPSAEAQRGFMLITLTTVLASFAMSGQQAVVTNFFENELRLAGPQFGYITAIREIPGFLIIFLTALFYRLSLPRLTTLALTTLAIGYALFSIATDFATVTPWVILSSMGYHTWLQTQHALAMSVTTENKSGAILGHVTALGNLGGLVAMIMMALGFYLNLMTFASAFWLTGLASLAAGIMIFSFPSLRNGVPHEVTTKREPIVIHKDYRFYYMLNLLDGGRQQIFFSFGLWVLAHKFNLDVTRLTMILIGVSLVNTLIGRRVGKLIDRFGERPMLAAANVLYVVALTGYAFSDNIWVLVACYTVYSVIFPISWVGANTYLRKIASHHDIAPSIAMGLTMQHVAAVIVPLATGYILNFYGYQIPFMIACAFAVITMISTRFINPATQKSQSRLAEDAAAA